MCLQLWKTRIPKSVNRRPIKTFYSTSVLSQYKIIALKLFTYGMWGNRIESQDNVYMLRHVAKNEGSWPAICMYVYTTPVRIGHTRLISALAPEGLFRIRSKLRIFFMIFSYSFMT